ncbi:matrixin family metalloprotease [Paenibacillus nasutitermitis]|uniref:matrixin family metalloprotease n=1 Tax=Paenibacillus nasutitermitis TaxID=1652958 RepID=UPI001E56689F|nr:matrixin family metalloprotease [Paenibacillus nasutitermitis]
MSLVEGMIIDVPFVKFSILPGNLLLAKIVYIITIFTSNANSGDAGLNNLWFYNYSGSLNKTNLQINTALHEIGHFIGLGHSTVSPTVMWATGLYTDTTPLQDDKNGANAIYP